MKTLLLISVLFLPGCAAYNAVKAATPVIEDKAVDVYYERICNLRYKVEQRFQARHETSGVVFQAFCKRLRPR